MAAWYSDFEQVTDDEVRDLLRMGGQHHSEDIHAITS